MTPAKAAPLAGLATVMAVIGITLFRMSNDKERAMGDDADSTCGTVQRRVPEPALLSIIESRRGRLKIKNVFRDLDVVMKLEVYKRALFGYNESGDRRGAALAHMEHACRVSFLTAGIVDLALSADALAASSALFGDLHRVALAVGRTTAALGAVAAGYTPCRYSAEGGAFRLEMRKNGGRRP